MAGHSKWSKVKRFKGAIDAKRGKLFSKLGKELTVAAKHGGGDPGFNPRLRTILLKAKAANMPADNIDRAIKKGTGELPGQTFDEITYEGYAEGGIALLVDLLTDNKNRTAAEIRAIFTKRGGHLVISKDQIREDDLLNIVLETGGEDVNLQDGDYEVITDPQHFETIHQALEKKGIKFESAEVTYIPITPVPITDESTARSVLQLVEALEDNDDVQNVYANFDISDDILAKISVEE